MGTTDLDERKQLRDNLQCLNFQWFLDYVYPDAPFPSQHRYFGAVRYPSWVLNTKQDRKYYLYINIYKHKLKQVNILFKDTTTILGFVSNIKRNPRGNFGNEHVPWLRSTTGTSSISNVI